MILRLPGTRDNSYIDTEEVALDDAYHKAKESFINFTKGTANEYCYEDVLAYIDALNSVVHGPADFDEFTRDYFHGAIDRAIVDGDIPGEVEFSYDEDFALEAFETGKDIREFLGHNYDEVDSHSHEENRTMLVLVAVICGVTDAYRNLTEDVVPKV